MSSLSMSVRVCAALLTLAAISAFAAPVSAQMHGAIFTTDAGGSTNVNLYDKKIDVWVNGGPRKEGSAGLPQGWYYIQVTNPSGSVVLGTSLLNPLGPALSPQTNPTSKTPIYVGANGEFADPVQLWYVVRYQKNPGPNGICQGYLDTPNNGGEYKVWVSQNPAFPGSETKTDNFKVRKGPPPPPQTEIIVWKFYDYDMSGTWEDLDVNEPSISGWRFILSLNGVNQDGPGGYRTTIGGSVSWVVPSNGATYVVTEILPSGDPGITWFVTTPGGLSQNVTVADGVNDERVVEFGNVARERDSINGYGLTKGFWHNQNGRDMMSHCYPEWIHMLNDMCLRYPNGDELYINPALSHNAAHAIFEAWIVGLGVEGNRAYALSTQLAAISLNVLCGPLSELNDPHLMVMWNGNLKLLSELFDEAVALLCATGVAEGSSAEATAMNVYQAFFDAMNNNKDAGGPDNPWTVYYWHTLLPIPNFYYN